MKLIRILRWLVLLLSVLLAVQSLARCHARQRGELGELYERYCEQPGVRVALVQNMPINDTLCKDILMLTATDSAGWAWIVKELSGYDEGTALYNNAIESNYGMTVHWGTKESPGDLPSDTTLYGSLKRGDNHELVRVCLLFKNRAAWITVPKDRTETLALIDLEFEEGNLI